jgi:hypothetical protein
MQDRRTEEVITIEQTNGDGTVFKKSVCNFVDRGTKWFLVELGDRWINVIFLVLLPDALFLRIIRLLPSLLN